MPESERDEQTRIEIDALERLGLRWSVLAAWFEELEKRKIVPHADIAEKLEKVRTKLSAGCYSSCEISYELAEIEGELVAKEATSPLESVDFWLELLGEAMAEEPRGERVLRYPPVRFHYLNCGFLPCRWEGFED